MRIGNSNPGVGLTSDAMNRSERSNGSDRTSGPGGDKVEISRGLSLASDQAARASRVAEVRAQIEAGGYPLDFAKLAERLVDDELARIGV